MAEPIAATLSESAAEALGGAGPDANRTADEWEALAAEPIRMFDAEGNQVQIGSAREARARFDAGTLGFRNDQPVYVQRPTGEIDRVLGTDAVQQALRSGSRLASHRSVVEARQRGVYESTGAVVTGAAEALVSGATLGLSRLGREGVAGEGAQERFRQVRERSPIAVQGAEIAGMLLPAVAGGLPSVAGRGLAARVATGVAEGAIGGAEYGAHEVITEAALGGPEITAERLATSIGGNALLGAAGGGVLSLGGAAVGAGFRRTRRALSDTVAGITRQWESRGGGALADGLAETFVGVMSAGRQEHRAILGEALPFTESGRRVMRWVNEGRAPLEAAIPRIRSQIDSSAAITDAAEAFARGEMKRAPIERAIAINTFDDAANAALAATQSARRTAQELADNTITQHAGNRMGRILDDATTGLDEAIARGTAAATDAERRAAMTDIFLSVDRAKRGIGPVTNGLQRTSGEGFAMGQRAYRELQEHLELDTLYGGAAAIQRDVNASWAPHLANERQFQSMFLAPSGRMGVGSDAFRVQMTADPAKIGTYLRTLGTPDGALQEEIFTAQIVNQQRLAETISRHMDVTPELRSQITAGSTAARQLQSEMTGLTERARVLNQWRALERSQAATSEVMGAGLGAAIGGLVGGLPGAAIGGGLVGALRRPATLYRTLGGIDRVTRGIRDSISRGVRSYSEKAAERAAAGVAGRRSATLRAVVAPATRQAYRLAVQRAVDFTGNPVASSAAFASRTEELRRSAPRTAAALETVAHRAAGFLASRVPPGSQPRPDLLQPQHHEPRVSTVEMSRFLRYARAVDNPLSVIDDLKDGRLSSEAVEAVREVYPELHAEIVRNVVEQLASERNRFGYEDRVQLGLLLGITSDPSLEPRFVASIQAMYAGQPPTGQQPSQAPSAPSRRPRPTQIAQSYATETQIVEQRAAAGG